MSALFGYIGDIAIDRFAGSKIVESWDEHDAMGTAAWVVPPPE